MGSDTLTDRDRQLLEQLSTEPVPHERLEALVPEDAEWLVDRLDVLVDVGLLRETAAGYTLTDSGRRFLAAPGDGTADDRIDVPPAVEAVLEQQEVDGACASAVRATYAFLQYWGESTASEFRDAIFAEHPAGYDDRRAWWVDCIEPVLGRLPTVTPPSTDSLTARWRYDGPPGIKDGSTDGRAVLGSLDGQPFGTARQAIEAQTESVDERAAVRHVFAHIETHGRADSETVADLVDGIGDLDDIVDVLASIPTVVRVGTTAGDGVWQYAPKAQ